MADCGKYDDMISALIDGELADSETGDLNEHARNCRSCAELIKLYITMSSTMNDTEETPPNDLSRNIMGQIRHDNKKSKRIRGLRRLTAVAAVLVVVISGLFMIKQVFPFSSSSNTSGVGESAVMEAAPDVSQEEFTVEGEEEQASDTADESIGNSTASATEQSEVEPSEAEPEQSGEEETDHTFYMFGEEGSSIEVFFTDADGMEIGAPVEANLLDELLNYSGVYNESTTGEPICKMRFTIDGEERMYSVWVSNDLVLVKGADNVLHISAMSLESFKNLLP